MRVRKLHLTALLTAVVVANAFSAASAGNLSFSNQNISATWERLEFVTLITVRCHLTLEGSLTSRTTAKVTRMLIGAITRATFPECADGTRTGRALPWHLTYESFAGFLPDITSVRFLLSRFVIQERIGTITCNYGTSTDNITFAASLDAARNVTELTPVAGRNVIHLLEGPTPFGCPPERGMVSPAGDGSMTTRITLI